MNGLLAINLIVLDIILLSVLPLEAQNLNTETEGCRKAIKRVENQLQTDRQLTIELSEMSDSNASIAPFEDRPHKYIFGIGGNAASSVMSSPVFSKSLATQIINNCDSVSSVSFGLWQTGWHEIYGLMPNGEIKIFECPEDFDVPYYKDFEWGESCSL